MQPWGAYWKCKYAGRASGLLSQNVWGWAPGSCTATISQASSSLRSPGLNNQMLILAPKCTTGTNRLKVKRRAFRQKEGKQGLSVLTSAVTPQGTRKLPTRERIKVGTFRMLWKSQYRVTFEVPCNTKGWLCNAECFDHAFLYLFVGDHDIQPF